MEGCNMRHDIPNIIKKLIYSIKGLKVKELFLLIFPLFIHNMVQAKDADGGVYSRIPRANR